MGKRERPPAKVFFKSSRASSSSASASASSSALSGAKGREGKKGAASSSGAMAQASPLPAPAEGAAPFSKEGARERESGDKGRAAAAKRGKDKDPLPPARPPASDDAAQVQLEGKTGRASEASEAPAKPPGEKGDDLEKAEIMTSISNGLREMVEQERGKLLKLRGELENINSPGGYERFREEQAVKEEIIDALQAVQEAKKFSDKHSLEAVLSTLKDDFSDDGTGKEIVSKALSRRRARAKAISAIENELKIKRRRHAANQVSPADGLQSAPLLPSPLFHRKA